MSVIDRVKDLAKKANDPLVDNKNEEFKLIDDTHQRLLKQFIELQDFSARLSDKEERYWLEDYFIRFCPDIECMGCSVIVCPHGEPLHFDKDGCPTCSD